MGYCLIEAVILSQVNKGRETPKSFSQILKEEVLNPLGMTQTQVILEDDSAREGQDCRGHDRVGKTASSPFPVYPFAAAAGLWSTSEDLLTLVREIQHGLVGQSQLGIAKTLYEDMVSPQFETPWAGLGLFLDQTEKGLEVSSMGWGIGFQSMVIGYLRDQTTLVVMTNSNLGVHQLKGFIGEVYRALFQS